MFTIALTFFLLLVSTLGLLLWVRTTRTDQNTVAVSTEMVEILQLFGQKKWQGYDISQPARLLQQAEDRFEMGDGATTSQLLSDARKALDSTSLLYRDHAKSLAGTDPNGNFLFLPWTTYTPFEREIEWAAQRYDVFVFGITQTELVQKVKTYNPDAEIFLYVDLRVTAETPASYPSLPEWNTILVQHPDWLLTGSDGRPVTTDGDLTYYWPNPGVPEFQTFASTRILQSLEQSQVNWDGVVLDSARTLRDLSGDGVADIATYPSDEAYKTSQELFLTKLHQTLHDSAFKLVTILPPYASQNEDWKGLSERSDGILLSFVGREDFNSESGFISMDQWRNQLRILEQVRSDYLTLVMTPVPFWSDKPMSLYGFATMLLSRDTTRDLLYYYGLEETASIPAYWYHEYEIDLGDATSPIATENDILVRLFQRGVVAVNPTDQERVVSFSGTYQAVTGETTSVVTLSPHTAVILKTPN